MSLLVKFTLYLLISAAGIVILAKNPSPPIDKEPAMRCFGPKRTCFRLCAIGLFLFLWLPVTTIGAESVAHEPAPGGELVVSLYTTPPHLNPAIQSGLATAFPGAQIFAGLVRFDKQQAADTESATNFLLNWIPYWATYHPLAIDSPMKLVFLYEAFVYFLLVIISLTYFSSAYYRTDSAYRFSIYMLLGSFVMATIESGNATVLRHKLVFVPCLFYLGYMNTKGMRLVIFKRFKRGFPLKRLSGEGSDGRVS